MSNAASLVLCFEKTLSRVPCVTPEMHYTRNPKPLEPQTHVIGCSSIIFVVSGLAAKRAPSVCCITANQQPKCAEISDGPSDFGDGVESNAKYI